MGDRMPEAGVARARARDTAPDESTDVVVVGGGGSGLAAAIEARAAGARVVVLEKNPATGGSTGWSVGSVSCSRTPHQARRGIEDDPEAHWEDMALFARHLKREDNDALRRVLCQELPDTFAWLLSIGVRFFGPMPEPPHRVPRMHNVVPNSRSFVHHATRRARAVGADLRVGHRAIELVFEEGRVRGVVVDTGEGTRRLWARRAVVLAAGDYTNDPELKRVHMGDAMALVDAVNPTATGDGQKLALPLGARILNGDLAQGPDLRFIAPATPHWVTRLPPWPLLGSALSLALQHVPPALLRPFVMRFVTTALSPSRMLFDEGAILVNREGRRFTDERDRPMDAVPRQPGKVAWIILDATLAAKFSAWPNYVSTAPGVAYAYLPDYRRTRPDVYRDAASVEALARALDMPEQALRETVDACNATATRPLAAPPFVALGPVRGVFVHHEGGLAVDLRHRVLGPGDRPIPGLYAAGSTGQGGLLLQGHGHHLAWAFTSGRRAGRFAAGEAACDIAKW
jgi:fumarate reductase flavoprotein subunit